MNDQKREVLVSTHDLSKSYGKVNAVSCVNMTIEKGDIYGFVGPNGAGKSTVIKMMTGMIKISSGKIVKRYEKLGAIIETPAFFDHLTGYENLKLMAIQMGSFAESRIDKVLEMVEMQNAADKKVSQYSLGMKQRLGIARAFLNDPELVILDEPTNGLDPYGIKAIRELIVHLSKTYHKTFLISSHILNELEQMCNKIGIIHQGTLVEELAMHALLEKLDGTTFEHYFLEQTKEDRKYV